jgi:hypothetical protein
VPHFAAVEWSCGRSRGRPLLAAGGADNLRVWEVVQEEPTPRLPLPLRRGGRRGRAGPARGGDGAGRSAADPAPRGYAVTPPIVSTAASTNQGGACAGGYLDFGASYVAREQRRAHCVPRQPRLPHDLLDREPLAQCSRRNSAQSSTVITSRTIPEGSTFRDLRGSATRLSTIRERLPRRVVHLHRSLPAQTNRQNAITQRFLVEGRLGEGGEHRHVGRLVAWASALEPRRTCWCSSSSAAHMPAMGGRTVNSVNGCDGSRRRAPPSFRATSGYGRSRERTFSLVTAVETKGIEPSTPALQRRCSAN